MHKDSTTYSVGAEMISDSEIREHVRMFIRDNFLFGDEDDRLSDEASFLETGLIDSTGILELIAFIERQYGFPIAEEELLPENLDSIANVTAYVGRKIVAGSSSP